MSSALPHSHYQSLVKLGGWGDSEAAGGRRWYIKPKGGFRILTPGNFAGEWPQLKRVSDRARIRTPGPLDARSALVPHNHLENNHENGVANYGEMLNKNVQRKSWVQNAER